jgi:hypothetical protein
MSQQSKSIHEETEITELTIGCDGRIYVFGLSQQILEVLKAIAPIDPTVLRLSAHVQKVQQVNKEN